MRLNTLITPTGRLRVEESAESLPDIDDSTGPRMVEAFSESNAAGLVLLASHELDESLPAGLVFWRGLSRRFFQAVCQQGESGFKNWKALLPPSDAELEQFVSDAPPMRGLEYLNVVLIRALWSELRGLVVACAAKHPAGPAAYLATVNPLWHLLGRVTFHLAENKRDPARPFAFLATYTHQLSRQSRLQHLPLAEAVKTYAGAKDLSKLESLLEPVRRAAGQSGLVRELLDSKALFSPQGWTIRQAHRFLTESPRMEEAGVVVRVPDWWAARRQARPQVQVRIGSQPASAIGQEGLLDFDVGLALEGEPLTDDERRHLLAAAEGLVLLRGKWVEVDRGQLQQALDHWKSLERQHANGINFIDGMRLLAGANLGAGDSEDQESAGWSRVMAGDWLQATLERMRRPETIGAFQPGQDLSATLRHYQADGVRWLWFMTELGLGACLADDMGLG
ncbi:MAG: ATP-dependent helicase, partial [Planctomycetia bacterium]|nr:ATP-dependent helicase [Planctomycetia bacterium]